MPLSYHWNTNSLQIVHKGNIHLLPSDDARYPWALQALSVSEHAVERVLNGELPNFTGMGTSWTLECRDDTSDWEVVDVFEDYWQACVTACEYLLSNTGAERVRVMNDAGEQIYALSSRIELAVS